MSVYSEKDLHPKEKALWLKAMSAMELRNFSYAIQLYQNLLKSHPEFLVARQFARKAAIAKTGGKKGMLSSLSTSSFSTLKVQSLLKKDPIAALDPIEKILENEPQNPAANHLLKEAALNAKMPDLAEFALETIIEGNPKDTKAMHELAAMYMRHEKPTKAVEVFGKVLEVTPNDLTAIKGGKDAAAAATMQRGGWEREETTYRDLIKDKDEAVTLEQQSRVVRSDEMIDNLLAELHAKIEQNAQDIDTSRRIAELYEQKSDLENAVAWYEYASQLSAGSDPSITRRVSDLKIRQYDESIAGFENYLEEHSDTPEAETYRTQLDDLKTQRAQLVIEEARRRVERNPTDLLLRFELGEILVSLKDYKAAISELQKARQNPSVRLKSMNLLGRCYTERGMFDLAAETLSTAASELYQMDATKKDIVYNLGLVYEKMEEKEKSIDCMKQIYSVDYEYRDVAERVESSY